MKTLIGFMLFITIGLVSPIRAQTSPNKMTAEELNIKVDKQLHELYGEYYGTYVEGRPDQVELYTDFYKRCEFLTVEEAPAGIDNISELLIIEKYNPEVLHHDNISTFDEDTFNVLKYRFDYYNTTDRYFKIYNTNIVLKINKM